MNKTFEKNELEKLYKYFQQAYLDLDTAYGEFITFTRENKIDYSNWFNVKIAFINADSEFVKLLDEVEKFQKAHGNED